ncbi:MAG: HAMP domain-containing histidine kinase [Moorea sp. SIOASIH]|uniref:sensor histidine kinase n=1 Tax=Moorena sp. SIOASIH TaxID=2607817 RepID=UPI0013BC3A16|nr:PAS domain-containing sensor histidine kinase [Moorena sp. SIOASIH]NEO41724.1 HAMP domain-containing histidine kinase [Moorena sp. SIOASIH]
MNLLAFLLGLALGIGLWLWQQHQLKRRLQQMLGTLQVDATSNSLSAVSRLRQAIAIANHQREVIEQELQTWQEVVQVAPLGYFLVDEENQLLWCNQQARQLLHIHHWESGQIRLLLEWVRSYELDQLIQTTRQQQEPGICEWVFHPSCLKGEAMGEMRSLYLRASSWPLPQKQVGVFLENQQPLVELCESRNQWFGDLAHELRTPLTSISLVAETLQSRLEAQESRWVDKMLAEVKRLIQLVEDWLEISKLKQDPTPHLNCQSIELKSLIFRVWQTLELLAQQKNLTLAYNGPNQLYLEADPSRLTQVFLNLFDNSIKHSPPQAAIRVEVNAISSQEAAVCDTWIQIKVIDAGDGFAESDLPRVFERLYRGDHSRAREQSNYSNGDPLPVRRGSGLGLSIVQQIIEAHGGSILATNHWETGGACIEIALPDTTKG